jgi:uncharacterized protein YgiM (DUF1202 family)
MTMKRALFTALGLGFLVAAIATSAQAATVATLTDIKLRRGPGTSFAAITTLPRGTRLHLGDCTKDLNWCKVYWRGTEGWASSHYLSEPGQAVAEAEPPVRRPRQPTFQDQPGEGDVLIGPADNGGYVTRPRIFLRLGTGRGYWDRNGYYRRYRYYEYD